VCFIFVFVILSGATPSGAKSKDLRLLLGCFVPGIPDYETTQTRY
jgi:hypothetical protein